MIDKLLRLMPDFRGKRRLVRMLFKNHIQTASNLAIKGSMGCEYILPNIKETISFDIFCNGIYEQGTNTFLLKMIPENGVFLDLGANIGSVVIPLQKKRPDIKCICVEAAPWISDYLEKNIALNFPSTTIAIINKALFDKSGETLPFYTSLDNFGKGSLSPVFTNDSLSVTTITIDDIVAQCKLQNVDMIKIDVEGYEYTALKGGINLLSKIDAPEIFFEFVDWAEAHAGQEKGAAQQLLIDFGYTLYRITESGELHKFSSPIRKGAEMLLASKRQT